MQDPTIFGLSLVASLEVRLLLGPVSNDSTKTTARMQGFDGFVGVTNTVEAVGDEVIDW